MGLYSGIVVLGLLVFGRRIIAYSKERGVMGLVFILLWGGALALTAAALLTSQSRGAWLAILLAMLMIAVVVHLMYRSQGLRVGHYGVGLAVMGVFLLPVIFLLHETIQKRVEVEADVYPAIISLNLEEVPYTSAGRRVHMWVHGLNAWSEKPVFGYGAGSAKKLLAKDKRLAIHPGYHSIYIQVLVELGVVGGGFFLAALLFLVVGFISAYLRGEVAPDIFVFIIGGWTMILVAGLFSTRLFQSDGRFMMLMLTGITLAYALGWVRNTDEAGRQV
jgi:O-antigen ligase